MRKIIFLLSAAAIGCRSEPTATVVICPSRTNYALHVRVVDHESGALAPFTHVSITASDGQYRDSVHVNAITDSSLSSGTRAYGLAYDRAGTYTIAVSAAGYARWTTNGFAALDHLKCAYASDTATAYLRRP